MSGSYYRYEKREKHTGFGSIVRYVAYCPVCKTLILPCDYRFSRRGTHSVAFFEHEHPLSFISLYRSSLSHASVHFEGEVPEEIKKVTIYLWVWKRLGYEDVLESIQDPQKLAEALEEIEQLEKPAPPPPSLEPNIKLLVQTRRGRSIFSTFVKVWDDRASIFDMPDCTDVDLLGAVYAAISRLPDRFKVPPEFSGGDYCVPRYFLITAFFDGEKAHIIDIVNIRLDGKVLGEWSYRSGYWAPLVTDKILYALKLHCGKRCEDCVSAPPQSP